jgi:hypothetical protein
MGILVLTSCERDYELRLLGVLINRGMNLPYFVKPDFE